MIVEHKDLPQMLTLQCPTHGCTRQHLKKVFLGTCELHQNLFAIISDEKGFYVRSEPLRHPLIFYYGHTASFYVNKLFDKGVITQRVDAQMEATMAVGVDEMKWDDLQQTSNRWPSLQQVKHFRNKVIDMVLKVIQTIDLEISWNSDCWAFLMGIEHQRVHLQTTSAIIRMLDIKYISQSSILKDCPFYTTEIEKIPQNSAQWVPSIEFDWPKQLDNANTYGWDNQFGIKHFSVKPFKASKMLVSNAEFMKFFNDGGYQKMQYWDSQGKQWLKNQNRKMPVYWKKQNDKYLLRTINKLMSLPLDWPAEVNNLQATAYCNWYSVINNKKIRLPTEEQIYSLKWNYVNEQNEKQSNKNLHYWFSPCPVNTFRFGQNFYDITGNVWQLSKTKIYLYQGFQPHPLYEDYTLPSVQDYKHYMLIGNSFASIGAFAHFEVRNTFRRHFHQASGFRYVEVSEEQQKDKFNSSYGQEQHLITTKKEEQSALKLHYEDSQTYINTVIDIVKDQVVSKIENQQSDDRCLVMGCSVGRIVLQLSKYFKHCIGTDYFVRYFSLAETLIDQGELKYSDKVIKSAQFCPCPQNVSFMQMNPQNPICKKIFDSSLIIIDGTNIKPNRLESVIKQTKTLLKQNCKYHYIIVNELGKNMITKQQFINLLPNSEQIVTRTCPLSSSVSCEEKIMINLYRLET